MKAFFKWTVTAVLGLAVVLAAAVAIGLQLGERKRTRTIDVAVQPIAYVSDTQSLQRGKYLFESRGCADCHGSSGAGRDLVKTADMHIAGANITRTGVTANYQPQDWVRTLRHGVKPNGQPLRVMPSEEYNQLTEQDLASLVAYVRNLPPQPGGGAVIELPLPARVLYGFGAIPDAADKIDHSRAPSPPVPDGINVQHGAYVANMCMGCHGEHLSGGTIPGGPPEWPAAANLTPGEGSVMGRYPDAQHFMAMFRSGKRPDGSAIRVMPFEALSKIDDVDAQALYAYLQTVPARPAGGR